MRIRILGGGWYGCHLARSFSEEGHDVELHERSSALFSGASGGNPARLHLGPHYPRSKLTRAFCQEHHAKFMQTYGHLTRGVDVNIYAVAAHDSLIDFGTYQQVLRGEIEFVTVEQPSEHGLENVEGAILTGERHIVIDLARKYFSEALENVVRYESTKSSASRLLVDDKPYDWTIDCTFCAHEAEGVDRYEACITALMSGPITKAVTIMDGPFPSLYPWNEERGLNSLTSAKYTPLGRFTTYEGASLFLRSLPSADITAACDRMIEQLAIYWPRSRDLYSLADHKLTIRAQPRSGSDARLVDIVRIGDRWLRVRAGKIDAILHAEQVIREIMHA